MPYTITLSRIYDAIHEPAGKAARVLTDRLWPRGLSKDELGDIQWLHEASPASELRKNFHSGAISPEQFQHRYQEQLEHDPDALFPLMKLARQGELQLLTATHDPQTSYLTVLKQAVIEALAKEDRLHDGTEPSSPVCYAHVVKEDKQ
ncbi:DUF488 domain-containing protein [Alcaligenes sp. SMD-FA]|uniref:DUF488 domain-containing protein n=1 Tax=Alcaligenes sp. SMD-FA TaxID=2991054 RepID=UPI002227AD74|nr:DUF488 family protein [Alcaligenes sp. SMD-FA]UYY87479.1 DUF488 family protein [Alcaligenes sp. SMD-FA]